MRLLFAVLLSLTAADCLADRFDVFLLIGQSNMDGRGQASQLSPDLSAPSDSAIICYRNALVATDGWVSMGPGYSRPPKFSGALPSQAFGPEIGFVNRLNATDKDRRIAIIKCSRGGTSLQKDWHPGTRDDPDTQGECYRIFAETLQQATSELTDQGHTWRICGTLWHQGESDRNLESVDYRRRLEQLIVRVREETEVPDLPFVIGEVCDNGQRDNVRKAAREVADRVPRTAFVPSSGLATWDNGTHFDARSQLRLGRRFGAAFRRLESTDESSQPLVVCFGDSITRRGWNRNLNQLLPIRTVNAGVGGHSSAMGLRRMADDVLSHNPDICVILFGTNDLRKDAPNVYADPEEYHSNLKKIISECEVRGIDVVLCTIPPITPEPFFERHATETFGGPDGLTALVGRYRDAALQFKSDSSVTVLDLHEYLSQHPEWVSRDGVHPSELGNALIAASVAGAVARLLPVVNNAAAPSPR